MAKWLVETYESKKLAGKIGLNDLSSDVYRALPSLLFRNLKLFDRACLLETPKQHFIQRLKPFNGNIVFILRAALALFMDESQPS